MTGTGTGFEGDAGEVRIVDFPETRVAVFRHRGDPALVGVSVKRFREWRKQHGWSLQRSATFNILYDDPAQVVPEAYRIDLCVAIPEGEDGRRCGILFRTIPAGRCAVLRYVGTDDILGERIRELVEEWFPSSGERRRQFPLFLQRVRFYPEVPEGEAVIDIFLPIA